MSATHGARLTRTPSHLRLVLICGALSALAAFSIDTYLPALPSMARSLHTTASTAQLTLTAVLIGLALGQLVSGPLSDAYGRRTPLLVGLVLYTLVTLLCAASPGVWWLIGLRLVQGLTGSSALVISRAVVRDHYTGDEAARFYSMLMLVNGTAPLIAPLLGGQLLRFGSWPLVFVVLAGLGAVLTVTSAVTLPETLPVELRHRGGMGPTLLVFRDLLKDRTFVGYGLSCGLVFAALFCYVSGATFVLQDIYGLSPQQFSGVFAGNAIGIIVVGQVGRRFIGRNTPRQVLTVGVGLSALGGFAVLACVLTSAPLALLLPSLFVVVTCIGLVAPNATALALADHPRTAGSASALVGVAQLVFGGLAAPLVGVAGTQSSVPLGVLVATLGVGAVLALRLVSPRSGLTSAEGDVLLEV